MAFPKSLSIALGTGAVLLGLGTLGYFVVQHNNSQASEGLHGSVSQQATPETAKSVDVAKPETTKSAEAAKPEAASSAQGTVPAPVQQTNAQSSPPHPTTADIASAAQTQSPVESGASADGQSGKYAVEVSIADQRVIIKKDGKPIKSLTASTGKADTPTPTGHFEIENERGNFFYAPEFGQGAYHWLSFLDHGIYLFHSIPTDADGNEIKEEADLLGKPASHGCVRLKREDAKWLFDTLPTGTPVDIH